jgi:type II secretory pathway component GspD/PulD (secretin)
VESDPKGTRVIILKHAKASDLHQTISQLLELDSPDFRVAADARTNRLLVHGTRERITEVLDLIKELDVPGAASTEPRPPQESLLVPGQPTNVGP